MKKILLALLLALAPLPALADPVDDARAQVLASPESAAAQLELVVALARSVHYDQAWEALTRLQGLDRDFAVHVADRYEARVVADPTDVDARLRLALGYYFRGDREAARGQLVQAAAIVPADPWIWNYLGFVQLEGNKTDLAIQSWKRALDADPKNALAHHLIGLALFRQGHSHDASEELELAAKLRATGAAKP
jgi:tetratricopeptide (TPR) repeat protein